MRIALLGDAQSPHLLKWTRALCAVADVELWVASSRGFAPAFDALVPPGRRLALHFDARHAGGNIALLAALPRLGAWLRRVDADWLHAHYLTSHGTLAWLAKRLWRLRGRIVGSAWGSDILLTPERSRTYRWLIRRVLRACTLTTSDSLHMAQRMRELGAGEVMTFPFGLEALPPEPGPKSRWLFFANRGLEPLYRPERVLAVFASVAAARPEARLIVANDGSLAGRLPEMARGLGLSVGDVTDAQVQFVGLLDGAAQAAWYARARWYLSLPRSDSVAVSVLEAMAHGCLPILSDLPANRELVRDGDNGLVLGAGESPDPGRLDALLERADEVARVNRAWVKDHALFEPCVRRFLERLGELSAA
jgi:L-malate glycosyltransferase